MHPLPATKLKGPVHIPQLVFCALLSCTLWTRAGLLKLCVATPFGTAKYNYGIAKQVGLANQI